MSILSIQSSVAYGHVGNSAAVFPLQRLGLEVWPVNTVQFSNHTGYGAWRGRVFEPAAIAEVIAGVEERGAFPHCAAVLSGYMGEAALGAVVLDAVARVKTANPEALYCCDPVIGDAGKGIFVRPGLVEFFRERAVPAADIITPNQFELELLAGGPLASPGDVLAAAGRLRAGGPDTVLVTSVAPPGSPPEEIAMMTVSAAGAWLVQTPRLPIVANGAGDLTAALFLAQLLKNHDAAAALEATAAAVYAVLRITAECRAEELALIAAQDEMVAPRQRFTPQRVG